MKNKTNIFVEVRDRYEWFFFFYKNHGRLSPVL